MDSATGKILGLVLPLIPGLIQLAENALPGDKQGPQKQSMILSTLQPLVEVLHKTNPGSLGPAELTAAVETIFQQKKAEGTLKPEVVGGNFTITVRDGKIISFG